MIASRTYRLAHSRERQWHSKSYVTTDARIKSHIHIAQLHTLEHTRNVMLELLQRATHIAHRQRHQHDCYDIDAVVTKHGNCHDIRRDWCRTITSELLHKLPPPPPPPPASSSSTRTWPPWVNGVHDDDDPPTHPSHCWANTPSTERHKGAQTQPTAPSDVRQHARRQRH